MVDGRINKLKASEDFVRSVLQKNFNQKVDDEAARAAAEKIVRNLPASEDSQRAA